MLPSISSFELNRAVSRTRLSYVAGPSTVPLLSRSLTMRGFQLFREVTPERESEAIQEMAQWMREVSDDVITSRGTGSRVALQVRTCPEAA